MSKRNIPTKDELLNRIITGKPLEYRTIFRIIDITCASCDSKTELTTGMQLCTTVNEVRAKSETVHRQSMVRCFSPRLVINYNFVEVEQSLFDELTAANNG